MADFSVTNVNNIAIIRVNLTRATLREAREFKHYLTKEIEKPTSKFIIDLSQCEFMDSTFVGVLVVFLKKISETGGELRLIEPCSIAHTVLTATGTLRIFNIFQSVQEAISDFDDLCAV